VQDAGDGEGEAEVGFGVGEEGLDVGGSRLRCWFRLFVRGGGLVGVLLKNFDWVN
jgi:hypothetical protein